MKFTLIGSLYFLARFSSDFCLARACAAINPPPFFGFAPLGALLEDAEEIIAISPAKRPS
jgi:hypothetical protein